MLSTVLKFQPTILLAPNISSEGKVLVRHAEGTVHEKTCINIERVGEVEFWEGWSCLVGSQSYYIVTGKNKRSKSAFPHWAAGRAVEVGRCRASPCWTLHCLLGLHCSAPCLFLLVVPSHLHYPSISISRAQTALRTLTSSVASFSLMTLSNTHMPMTQA